MQVIGFNFKKISAERKKPAEGKIQVDSNIHIQEITSDKVELIQNKEILKFDFEFTISYSPNFAAISFEGSVLITLEKKESKDILKKWKEKKISDELKIPLFNLILTKSNLKALQLEEELGLPAHIPLPKLGAQKKQDYVA